MDGTFHCCTEIALLKEGQNRHCGQWVAQNNWLISKQTNKQINNVVRRLYELMLSLEWIEVVLYADGMEPDVMKWHKVFELNLLRERLLLKNLNKYLSISALLSLIETFMYSEWTSAKMVINPCLINIVLGMQKKCKPKSYQNVNLDKT